MQDGCLLAQVTLWMMCMEHCLVQLSTLCSKRPFFNPRVSHLRAPTLLPLGPPPVPHPPPAPSCPASPGPGPSASCGWTGAGRRWTLALSSEETCFSVGRERVGVGWVEGSFTLFIWGMGGIVPRERGELNFHMPLFLPACTCRGVETLWAPFFFFFYPCLPFENHRK